MNKTQISYWSSWSDELIVKNMSWNIIERTRKCVEFEFLDEW